MKLPFAQIAGFLQKPPDTMRAILVYGPDAGLVSERMALLTNAYLTDKADPFCQSSLTGAQINADPARLYDEAAALSLGGGRRVVSLLQPLDGNASALASFLEEPPATNSLVLIEAGDLDKRSKLRALCEGPSQLAAAIPCYHEDARDRMRVITTMLQTEKLTAPADVIRLLAEILPPDRLALRSEMDKLVLYAMGQKEITMADVEAVIADAGGAEIDDLTQAVASGDVRRAMNLLDHLYAEQTSPVALLRGLQRHLMRLQLARAFMADGASANEALKKLSPPVFWKNVDPMLRQLSRWSLERLEQRLSQLTEAEAAVKRTGTPDTTLCAQLILSIAAKA